MSHDYHLTMFPRKLFLLERNRWKMLLADLRGRTRLALAPLLALSELMMWGYCLLRGPRFLRAKWESYRWIAAHRERIRERRDRRVDTPAKLRLGGAAWAALGLPARPVPHPRARAR